MAMKHVPFIICEEREATSASTFTIKSPPIRSEGLIVIETISVCDNDTDTKLCHIGVIRNEKALYVQSVALTTKTYFYMIHPDLHIPSDYRIIVKIVTPTSGDKIYVNIFGHFEVYD